ncbi:unnamed protein product [Adineta steineri]|uniref:EGF-like domain-containing protein n=1 Tax=Adineta steineri TaxID=433720 RepID=A0A814FMG3_9BILA|nr:unnamed protein product [Adineta steineri]
MHYPFSFFVLTILSTFTIVNGQICTPDPCANGGQCVPINAGTDYYCDCLPGLPLGGKDCDVLITTTS